ncbi:unnamed protein product [Triticum turgidum subsp. durum]|uniref:BHLH domain-containing protein n=1 Tax=Triticum turgidum subsp. durum TaxID=4567 RepID=A0A9R0QB12_TRITD|nr:unnamed protein product [Triticum turgidum subsp. durum]
MADQFRMCLLVTMRGRSEQGSSHQLDTFAQLDGGAAPEEPIGGGAAAEMADYMLGQTTPLPPGGPHGQVSLDKLSFSDVLQFADFGPRLALNQPSADHDDARDDDEEDSYFFRFQSQLSGSDDPDPRGGAGILHAAEHEGSKTADGSGGPHDHGGGVSESTTLVQQSDGGGRVGQKAGGEQAKSGRRKRPRSTKTSEEVESQRMTHIAVERNRRRQMNDYLRVLRSLMPGSYVQREVAENKSSLADIEVRVLGEDAVIKVLSRRRPEQLIKTIAVLEEMHMSILHTNITTIEQTVLYSFNVKITSEPRFTAEEIVGAVHQILSFIDVNYTL